MTYKPFFMSCLLERLTIGGELQNKKSRGKAECLRREQAIDKRSAGNRRPKARGRAAENEKAKARPCLAGNGNRSDARKQWKD